MVLSSAIPRQYRKYEKSVTISVVNHRPIWGNRAASLAKMMQTITFAAAHRGAGIIVFPEMALTGYECGEGAPKRKRPCSMHRRTAETIPGPSTQCLAGLANQLGVYVIFGMPELDVADGSVYKAVAVVGPEGIIGSYRGLYPSPAMPWWTERLCFKAGSRLPVFDTRYGPVAVQTGGDFWIFPGLARLLVLKGARIVFNCAAIPSGPGLNELMTSVAVCRAAENAVYIAVANLVGVDRDRSFCGRSIITGPDPPAPVSIYAQGDGFEGIVTAALDFEKLHSYRGKFNLEQQPRLDLVAGEYSGVVRRASIKKNGG